MNKQTKKQTMDFIWKVVVFLFSLFSQCVCDISGMKRELVYLIIQDGVHTAQVHFLILFLSARRV